MPGQNSDSEQERKKKSKGKSVGAILSTVLWTVGFALLFILKPGDRWIWTSDALLLLGFFPLLFVWKPGWTWLVFGLLNMFTGFMLEMAKILPEYIKDETLWTPEVMAAQEHMAQMHNSTTWILIGFAAVLFGLFRISRTIVRWVIRRFRSAGEQ